MAAFQAVNTALVPGPPYLKHDGETDPTIPMPAAARLSSTQNPTPKIDDAKTPTKTSFGTLSSRNDSKSVAEAPSTGSSSDVKKVVKRESSQYSTKSRESEDVDMGDSDGDDDGSDDDSVAPDGTRTAKKKRSQRFFCTDYPPCNLSFTRSEHLARHIRKHTGERPFQCHCSRRFSRLDNLRQHAQTVHVNEEIPGDSLAASGTRFQRQLRTDRVRPPGNRSRANTSISQSSQHRGHTRNSLSASSIGSMSSMSSIYASRDDFRRRPPPLVMATDPRSRIPFDSYASNDAHYMPMGGYHTPTSSRLSAGYDNSQWSSAMGSPFRNHSRTSSMYSDGRRTPGRRLSVPSSEFASQGFGPSSFGQSTTLAPLNSGSQETFSPAGSILASPTSSIGSSWSRRESLASAADDYRRRTWHHPESYQGFTSRLQSVMTPPTQRPSPPQITPSTSGAQITLPGIESFLSIPRPETPPRRNPSPMLIDTPDRSTGHPSDYNWSEERSGTVQWETNLPRNFTRLEIAQATSRPDDASSWASDVTRAVHERARQSQASPRPPPRVTFNTTHHPSHEPPPRHPDHHISAPPLTPRESKRQGWYADPLPQRQRTSPEGSSSSENGLPGTPNNTAHVDFGPVIVQPGAWDDQRERERERPRQTAEQATHQQQAYPGFPSVIEQAYAAYEAVSLPPPPVSSEQKADDGMLRLEALVAVATGERENTTATAY